MIDKMNRVIVIIIFGRSVLNLFGAEYLAAYPILVICVIASLVGGLTMPAAYLLLYSSNINTLIRIDIIQFFITLLLGIILTFLYNIIGIMCAWLMSQIIVSILLVYYTKTRTGIKSTLLF